MNEILRERVSILRAIFPNFITAGNNRKEISIFCPKHYHRKKKLQINVEKNVFQCWVCGYSGKVGSLLYEVANPSQRRRYFATIDNNVDVVEESTVEVELPEEYTPLYFNRESSTSKRAFDFLVNKRKIAESTILKSRLGYCDSGYYSNRIVYPSFDSKGKVNYFITRTLDEVDKFKYLNCSFPTREIIFNELFLDFSKPIILVEGVNAYLRHFVVPNIVPTLGSKISNNSKLYEHIIMRGCPKVYLAFDPDAEPDAIWFGSSLYRHGIKSQLVNLKTQPDMISTSSFLTALQQSVEVQGDDYLLDKIIRA